MIVEHFVNVLSAVANGARLVTIKQLFHRKKIREVYDAKLSCPTPFRAIYSFLL